MNLTRTKAAFRFATKTLFEKAEGRPYFWTFTLREAMSIPEAIVRWNKLAKSIWNYGRKKCGEQTIYGLRVFEVHEGGHGLHIHALFNRRIPIQAIRRRAEQFGFFWIDVRRVKSGDDIEAVSEYLSCYLAKGSRPECLKGKRLWAAIGKWGQTRCKDIEIQSEFAEAYRARRKMVEAEAKAAEIIARPYRRESTLETMHWSRLHVLEVHAGIRQPLRPELWKRFDHDEAVEETWEDRESAWTDVFETIVVQEPEPAWAWN